MERPIRAAGTGPVMFWQKSLRARLVASFMLLSLATVGLTAYAAFEFARSSLTEAVYGELSAIATLKRDEISRWIADQREDVLLIASLPEVKKLAVELLRPDADDAARNAAREALGKVMGAVLARKQDLREIAILSEPGGKVVFSSDPNHEEQFAVNAAYFKKGRLGVHIENVYLSPVTLTQTMTIAAPLLSETGRQIGGVLAVHLNLERMDKIILKRAGLGESGRTYLVDKNNDLVSQRGVVAGFPRGVHSAGIEDALAGRDGRGMYEAYDGEPVIGAYLWLDNRDLALMAERSRAEAFAPARRLAELILLSGLALAGLFAVGAYVLARRISRPIEAIKNVAVQVAEGDLDRRAPEVGADEVGALGRSFNLMTGRLKTVCERLQRREAHFRSIIERSADLVAVLDAEGLIRYASPSTENALGRSGKDLEGHKFFDHLEAGDLESVRQTMAEQIRFPEKVMTYECRLRGSGGVSRIYEGVSANLLDEPAVAGVVFNFHDITEKKEAEDALRRAERNYRDIFENAVEGIYQSTPDGRFRTANPSMARLLGYETPEALIKDVADIGAQCYADSRERNMLLGLLAAQGVVSGFEARFLRKNAETIWLSISARNVRSPKGELLYVEGSCLDVTERKLAEENLAAINRHLEELVEERTEDLSQRSIELEGANARLKEADALKDALMSTVSHDLRTPLTSILGFAKVIRKDFEKVFEPLMGEDPKRIKTGERIRIDLDIILKEGNRLTRLINDFLDLSRIESGRQEWRDREVRLDEIIRDAVNAVRGQFEGKPEVELRALSPEEPLSLYIDPDRLQQVLVNLLHNAAKFTEKGSVTIFGKACPPDCVRISVSDTGMGIPEAELGKIFDKFHKVEGGAGQKTPGTGLGLAICREVVKHYQGVIRVESTLGQGSEFIVELPLSPPEGREG